MFFSLLFSVVNSATMIWWNEVVYNDAAHSRCRRLSAQRRWCNVNWSYEKYIIPRTADMVPLMTVFAECISCEQITNDTSPLAIGW